MGDILLDRIRNDDESAFEDIYRKFYEELCHFSAQITHDENASEEIVDDVLFYIWDKRKTLKVDSLKAYLIRSVRNNSIHFANSYEYKNNAKSSELRRDIQSFNEYLSEGGQPIGVLIEKELTDELDAAINSLSEECRRVFLMSREEHKKYYEIAESLGISVNTVKYHIRNAISQIFKKISKF